MTSADRSTPAPTQPGRLTGPDDHRLQPRESHVYGRATEVADVLAFLRGTGTQAAKAITGVGGTGKTEVCKAALKAWLSERPDAVAYYVAIGDRSNTAELISAFAHALGVGSIQRSAQLLAIIPPATYYLKNLEGALAEPEGRDLVRALAAKPGVRLLTSSRVDAPNVLGAPIEIEALPEREALQLFRDSWTAEDPLPDDETLARFVIGELRAHALSVTLTARLGGIHSYASLLERWAKFKANAERPPIFEDEASLGSLAISLRLTASALWHYKGALELWVAAALFPVGIPDSEWARVEEAGGWSNARSALVQHHLVTWDGDRWRMLPPIARFGLDASAWARTGFDWSRCRKAIRAIFEPHISLCSQIASTEDVLAARAWVLDHFEAVTRLLRQELAYKEPQIAWVEVCHHYLQNVYQLRVGLSQELLPLLIERLEQPASALKIMGMLETRIDHFDGARVFYELALAAFERAEDLDGQASTLHRLGELESVLKRPEVARPLYERALAIYEKVKDDNGQANILHELGEVETQNQRFEEARAFHERALTLYIKLQQGVGQANTLQSLGDLRRATGDFSGAVNLYERSAALHLREQTLMGAATAFADLARCHNMLGNSWQRDHALVNAFQASARAETVSVTRYVEKALLGVTGSPEAAQDWRKQHNVT